MMRLASQACTCLLVLNLCASPSAAVLIHRRGGLHGGGSSMAHGDVAAGITPIGQVVNLLSNLQARLEDESKKDAAQYDKYACFCKEQLDEKVYAIERSGTKIEKLKAKIGELDPDIKDKNVEISSLSKKITELNKKITVGFNRRKQEHKKYKAAETDTSDGIDSLKASIDTLESAKDDISKDKSAFIQLQSFVGGFLKTGSLASFASLDTSDKQLDALTELTKFSQNPDKYNFHENSEKIITTMEDLLEEFEKRKKELDQTEFERRAAFEKRDGNLKNQRTAHAKDRDELEKIVSRKSEELEGLKQDKDKESASMAADLKFREELVKDCEKKAELWDVRSHTRAGELRTIADALGIIKEAAESYKANKKLVALQLQNRPAKRNPRLVLQTRVLVGSEASANVATSLLQLRSASSDADASDGAGVSRAAALLQAAAAARAGHLLETSAGRLHSTALALASLKARVSKDHFAKVRRVIKDIINRLAAAAADEKDENSFCNKGMKKALEARDKSEADLERLGGSISKANSDIKRLTQEIADLSDDTAITKKGLLEATELRENESDDNEERIEIAKEGRDRVKEAIGVLKDFYEEANIKEKFIQTASDAPDGAPEIFEDTYHGDQSSSKGIIGVLEVIVSDFDRTIKKASKEEEDASEDFEKYEEKAEESIDKNKESVKSKKTKIVNLKDEAMELEDEVKDTKKILAGAMDELELLETKCVAGEETYADRVKKRQKEVEALKEALDMLENWKQ